MNRRSFIQSLAAAFSLPANPLLLLRPATAAIPAVVEVPVRVKSWAVYMSNLHGDCTPLTLHRLLHIPEADATRYVNRLIADGVLKPNGLVQESLRNLVKSREGRLMDELESQLEMQTPDDEADQNAPSDDQVVEELTLEADLPESAAEQEQPFSDAASRKGPPVS